MNRKNLGKLLGVKGLVIVTASFIPSSLYDQYPTTVGVVSSQRENKSDNLVIRAFNDGGIPGLRIVNVSGSIQTTQTSPGIGIYLLPSIVEIDSQV